jgi:ADP-heptose:LPS heptosyltransferase
VGYDVRWRGRFYSHRIPRDSDRRGRPTRQYAARINLDVVARCGVRGPALDDVSLVYVADPNLDREMAQRLEALAPRRPRIGIAAAGTWQAKTYETESYARVADRLVDAGCQVLLLWGPGEREVAAEVQAKMRLPALIAPETDLETLPALLVNLDLLVGNDSGVKHLAVARGTPTLTLFGPTNPLTWMPPGEEGHGWVRVQLPCVACDLTRCTHHLCMRLLPPKAVSERALALLDRRKRPDPSSSGMELAEPPG